MTLLDEMKNLTTEAKERKHRETLAADKNKKQQDKQDYARGLAKANDDLAGILEDIRKAAKDGDHSFSVSIFQWRDSSMHYPYDHGYAGGLTSALLAEGFSVEGEQNRMEPCGSDPLFYNTVYDYDLLVSWK